MQTVEIGELRVTGNGFSSILAPMQTLYTRWAGVLLLAAMGMSVFAEKRIVLVAGRQSHGPGDHEFNAGSLLLNRCLNEMDGIVSQVVKGGWPEDESVFDGADAVLFYMDGGGGHPVIQEGPLKVVDALADKGVGLGFAHYGVEVPAGDPGKAMQKWIGGYYEHAYSCNPMWTPTFESFPDHPITRGVKPFSIKDEWYINMRFRPDMGGIVPILAAPPSDDVRDGPYVHPRGPYQHIMDNRGRKEVMMWATERPDGGRGFGFTGGHIHRNWGNESFRRVLLNGLLWLAKAEVPEGGVDTSVTDADLDANLDPKWITLVNAKGVSNKLRGYKMEGFPEEKWVFVDGALKTVPGSGVDLVTTDKFDDFELEFEWKVSPRGNSGVMINVAETDGASYFTGPEYQVLDNDRHPDGQNPKRTAGSLYDMIAPNDVRATKPVGEFNKSKIVSKAGFIEHWLNGKLVVAYEWGSYEISKKVRKSKFKDWPAFMSQHRGHIAFQHHGEEVWYRNVRVRRLAGPAANTLTEKQYAAGWRLLYNGKTSHGWRNFKKSSFPGKGWEVHKGRMRHLKGAGGGSIITDRKFNNYEFSFEWKISEAGNSGVKYFITEQRNGTVGHEYQVLDDARHPDGKVGLDRQTGALYDVLPVDGNKHLNPVGEYNRSKIVVDGNHIEHWLNGYRVLEFELGSEKLTQGIATSKFKRVEGFGTKYPHHLLLQDHQDEVAYKNLRIREFD